MKKFISLILLVSFVLLPAFLFAKDVRVKDSYRKDGTYDSSISPSINYDSKAILKPFTVYFKNGWKKLVCDHVWAYGNYILLVVIGKEFVLRYDKSEIDVEKSFSSGKLDKPPANVINAIKQMK